MDQQHGAPVAPSDSDRRGLTLGTSLMIGGGGAAAIGALLPWAEVRTGKQINDLIGRTVVASITGMDLDARSASAIFLLGILAALSALAFLADPRRFRVASLAAGLLATLTAVVGYLEISAAQSPSATTLDSLGPISAITNLIGPLLQFIDISALVTVSVGIGIWVVLAGGIAGAVGGLLAYNDH
jgi:hypothetical protein